MANRRVTIRTYRYGPGDNHLVTLNGDGGKTWRILIASALTEQVMGDILRETGGHVDLLVATQTPMDDSSGFGQSAEAFAKLDVSEVWLPWTEDPNDPAATALRDERGRTLDKLRLAGAEVQLRGSDAETRAINSLLAFYGVAGRAPNGDPLAAVRAKTHAPVYCRAGDAPRELPGVGARIYVLGPLHSATDAVGSNLALDEFVGKPFSTLYAIPDPVARAMPFFQEHYWEDAPWRRIDTAWITDATQYARVLDSLTRDTRLGLAIELDGGDVLLFAPDGQVGNWLSPGELGWSINERKVDGRDLLTHTVFYKVGHHAGVNATAGSDGLGLMPRLRVAVIPVDQAAALPIGAGDTPLEALQRALAEATGDRGYVLRTDQDAPDLALNRGVSATAGYFDVRL
jgi:hypothetical protein